MKIDRRDFIKLLSFILGGLVLEELGLSKVFFEREYVKKYETVEGNIKSINKNWKGDYVIEVEDKKGKKHLLYSDEELFRNLHEIPDGSTKFGYKPCKETYIINNKLVETEGKIKAIYPTFKKEEISYEVSFKYAK